jgi:GT2 family glycosyltransferase
MNLSIVIVNWNSLEFTKNCIASLQSTIHGLDYEIIVVDNASNDDLSVLGQAFPSVKLVCHERNIGFARANNLGVEHSCGDNILLLNPDTVVLDDAIQRMVLGLDSAPEIGAVGCRLLNGDSTLQMTCVQPFPTIANQIFAIDWLKRLSPKLPLWGMRALFSSDQRSLSDVEVVSGACLMVKREAFERVGGFSTDYFMYAEEVDLCYKLRAVGWSVCHVPDSLVIHFGGQSTKKKENGFADIMMRESVHTLLRKFRGYWYALLYRVAILSSALLRLAALLPLLAIPNQIVSRDRIAPAFRKWRRIAAWSLSLDGLTHQFLNPRPNSNTANKI